MPGDDVARSVLSRRRFLEHAGPWHRGERDRAATAARRVCADCSVCTTLASDRGAEAEPAQPSRTDQSAAIAAAVKPTGVLPTYVALASKPKPDFPARDERYEDGYLNYPANPTRSVPEAPGMGGTFNAMTIGLFPPPTPFDQNAAWQAVNKALNATMQFTIVPQSEYPAKMGVLMAGGDLPDFTFFFGGQRHRVGAGAAAVPSVADG